jgi:hypothetical protein
MYIIYNCGHYLTLTITAKSGKKYSFKKRYVTKVDNKDADYFLNKTSNDISWCPANSRNIPPFMKLEDWCKGKKGRFDSQPFKIYDPEKYKALFLL